MSKTYIKHTWVNDSPPALNAENLNAIEKGIGDAIDQANANETAISSTTSNISENATAISDEITRAKAAEKANEDAITAETTRAEKAESVNSDAISSEVTRAKAAEKANADAISANTSSITTEVTRAKAAEKALMDVMHPVGSIMLTMTSTNPGTMTGFSGTTWKQISQGRFLLGASTDYSAGATGGEATHTLTTDEMPAHNHAIYSGFGNDSSEDAYRYSKWGGNSLGWHDNGGYGTSVTGGGKAHNNMPPYLVCYMWHRTA